MCITVFLLSHLDDLLQSGKQCVDFSSHDKTDRYMSHTDTSILSSVQKQCNVSVCTDLEVSFELSATRVQQQSTLVDGSRRHRIQQFAVTQEIRCVGREREREKRGVYLRSTPSIRADANAISSQSEIGDAR